MIDSRLTCKLALRIIAFVVALLSATMSARATTYGDITVTTEPQPPGTSTHGYAEYGIVVINRSPATTHSVTVILPGAHHNAYSDYLREISRTVEVSPGATVRVALLQPQDPPVAGNQVRVILDGRYQEDLVPLDLSRWESQSSSRGSTRFRGGYYTSVTATTPNTRPLVLVSKEVKGDFLDAGNRAIKEFNPAAAPPPDPTGKPAPTFQPAAEFVRAETIIPAWSTNWLAYSRYDGVVLTDEGWRSAPPAVQTALLQYTECGGCLLILGQVTVPNPWRGTISTQNELTVASPGFGELVIAPASLFTESPSPRWQLMTEAWRRTAGPWRSLNYGQSANHSFPVVEEVDVPVRGLLLLMVVFVIAIGPVNLALLDSRQRRIWFLWTTPLISFVTCLAVFGYMLIVEGWERHSRAIALTVLDETSHRATTLGVMGVYCPFTPGEGLHFSADTEVVPLSCDLVDRSGTAYSLDWTSDQHLVSGWVKARIPAHFMLRKNEIRRERVTFHRDTDGSITMVNGLGAPISKILYADEQGRLYSAENVGTGEQQKMILTDQHLPKPSSKSPSVTSAAARELRQLYGTSWFSIQETCNRSPEKILAPRRYFAILDETPFLEPGLKATPNKSRSAVLGILQESDHES